LAGADFLVAAIRFWAVAAAAMALVPALPPLFSIARSRSFISVLQQGYQPTIKVEPRPRLSKRKAHVDPSRGEIAGHRTAKDTRSRLFVPRLFADFRAALQNHGVLWPLH
jgi:hypothetical protein